MFCFDTSSLTMSSEENDGAKCRRMSLIASADDKMPKTDDCRGLTKRQILKVKKCCID